MSAMSLVPDPSGILLVDKPATWTSHDVVAFIRRFGFAKVGHAGTLDPAATGLLVLLIGRDATRAAESLTGQDKQYAGTIRLGIETDSLDADGKVFRERPWQGIDDIQVRRVCGGFVGEIMQIPPMVSAIRINGRRLHEMARKGETVDRPPRPVTIHSLTVNRVALPEIDIEVHCSKGTYIRTLAADIGEALGCGAHLSALRRLGSGAYRLADAIDLAGLRAGNRESVIARLLPVPLPGSGGRP